MESYDAVEKVLAHYGVKGMRWGVRRARSGRSDATDVVVKALPGKRVSAEGGKRQPPSDDAKKAAASFQKARASTVDSLSNTELQALVTRMNLEQQYARLSANSARKNSGRQFVEKIVAEVAKDEVTKLVKGQPNRLSTLLDSKAKGKHLKK